MEREVSPDKHCPETKDPSGGTAGRVKPYGRLGWMGARAVYSLVGERLPLPHLFVAEGTPHVQTALRFFYLWAGIAGRSYGFAGPLASPAADVSEAVAAAGWFKGLAAAGSCRSEAVSAAGVSGTAAIGAAGGAPIAETAA